MYTLMYIFYSLIFIFCIDNEDFKMLIVSFSIAFLGYNLYTLIMYIIESLGNLHYNL